MGMIFEILSWACPQSVISKRLHYITWHGYHTHIMCIFVSFLCELQNPLIQYKMASYNVEDQCCFLQFYTRATKKIQAIIVARAVQRSTTTSVEHNADHDSQKLKTNVNLQQITSPISPEITFTPTCYCYPWPNFISCLAENNYSLAGSVSLAKFCWEPAKPNKHTVTSNWSNFYAFPTWWN